MEQRAEENGQWQERSGDRENSSKKQQCVTTVKEKGFFLEGKFYILQLYRSEYILPTIVTKILTHNTISKASRVCVSTHSNSNISNTLDA
jgi:hypothetical protein